MVQVWIPRKKWEAMELNLIATRGQVKSISKFLGISFYDNQDTKKQKEPNNLHVAAQLLKRTAELLEEINSEGKNQ